MDAEPVELCIARLSCAQCLMQMQMCRCRSVVHHVDLKPHIFGLYYVSITPIIAG